MSIRFILLAIIALTISACTPKHQQKKPISVEWELLENNYENKALCLSKLELINHSNKTFKDYKIYFNFCRFIHPSPDAPFSVNHINGDFFTIKNNGKPWKQGDTIKIELVSDYWAIKNSDAPSGFYLIDANDTVNIGEPQIKPFTKSKQINRSKDDIMALETPELAYKRNAKYEEASNTHPFIPSPKSYNYTHDTFTLNALTHYECDNDFVQEADLLQKTIKKYCNINIKEGNSENMILLKKVKNTTLPQEWYSISISNKQILLEAGDKAGIINAIHSLTAYAFHAKTPENKNINFPGITVKDYPDFTYRGMHIDIARNFLELKDLKKIVDAMSIYKLNKLHLHFCDDEAWRIQIEGLPELTTVGAFRAHSDDPTTMLPHFGSGPYAEKEPSKAYYTKEDFISLIAYCKDRNISIIPELDIPGHARAAIVAMQQRYKNYLEKGDRQAAEEYLLSDPNDASTYRSVQNFNDNVVNPAMESVYRFIGKVCDELLWCYTQANVKAEMIHIGGDEVPEGVWEHSPEVEKLKATNKKIRKREDIDYYFKKRVAAILKDHKLNIGGWEETVLTTEKKTKKIDHRFIGDGFVAFIWNNMWNWGAEDLAYRVANAGYPVVLNAVTNLYFDMAYNKNPDEPGYYWGNFTNTKSPFDFCAFDVLQNGTNDNMGHKIDFSKYDNNFEHLTEKGKKNILGIQGLLWSETTKTAKEFEYMIFPKLLGLAERAWNPRVDTLNQEEKDKAWAIFAKSVGTKELQLLDKLELNYRIPTPGANIKNGILYANSFFPGLKIQYTDFKENAKVKTYTKPIAIGDSVNIWHANQNDRKSKIWVLH